MSSRVIGLTGPIGRGEVDSSPGMLRELGAKVIDADAVVRDEQSRGTVGYSAIVQTFGTHVLGEDKEIDRAKLAAEVFADPKKLARLERIMHPRVIARILEARKMLRDNDVMVVEAIKLLESDLRNVCDEIWVVLAPEPLLLERLQARGLPKPEAELRLLRQASEEEFRAAADVVIVNDGDRDATRVVCARPGSACGRRPAARSLRVDLFWDLDAEVRVDVAERRTGRAAGPLVLRCAQKERDLTTRRLQVRDPLRGHGVDTDRVDAREPREDRQTLEDDLRAEVGRLLRRGPLELRLRIELQREHHVDDVAGEDRAPDRVLVAGP